MEETPDVISASGIGQDVNEADAERRLKLVYCKGHPNQSFYIETGRDTSASPNWENSLQFLPTKSPIPERALLLCSLH